MAASISTHWAQQSPINVPDPWRNVDVVMNYSESTQTLILYLLFCKELRNVFLRRAGHRLQDCQGRLTLSLDCSKAFSACSCQPAMYRLQMGRESNRAVT